MLLDDRRGSVGQALGIAEALGDRINIIEKKLTYNWLCKLPNFLRGRSLIGINKKTSDSLAAPYPDIVLSTSRRTVAAARYIRKQSGFKTKIVHLMYPSGGGISDMEMIVVPAHDSTGNKENPKSFVIPGAPTRIFPEKLQNSRNQWDAVFHDLPKPRTAVIIGGGIKGKPWPADEAETFAKRLKEIHAKIGGSFLLTTSRRTGQKAQSIIMNELTNIPMYTYLWGEKKENPIMGFYACPDLIIVTADSVSMCSEACGTGKPVLLYKGQWLTAKHLRFAQSLIDNGYAQDVLAESALDFKPTATLNPAIDIAEKILVL